jgi:hypothetical protein
VLAAREAGGGAEDQEGGQQIHGADARMSQQPAGRTILRFDNASATLPLHFIATYLLDGEQPLIERLAERH